MTKFHYEEHACPFCRHNFQVRIWDSIDTGETPHAKDLILSNTFAHETCPKCLESFPVHFPMQYTDIESGLSVYVADKDPKTMIDAANAELSRDMSMGLNMQALFQSMEYRIVRDIDDLREKILIKRHGYNDKAMELTKLFIDARFEKEAEVKSELTRYGHELIDGKVQTVFYIFTSDNRTAVVEFTPELYDIIAECFSKETARQPGIGYEIIDRDWAEKTARKSISSPFWEEPGTVH